MFRLLVLALPLHDGSAELQARRRFTKGWKCSARNTPPSSTSTRRVTSRRRRPTVRDVLLDFEHASKVTDNVAESHVLDKNAREIVVYQRLKLPIISDRDFTLRATWGQKRGRRSRSRSPSTTRVGRRPRTGSCASRSMQGNWQLSRSAAARRRTRAIACRSISAGSVPTWMVSGGAAKNIPKLFDGVRREATARMCRARRWPAATSIMQ